MAFKRSTKFWVAVSHFDAADDWQLVLSECAVNLIAKRLNQETQDSSSRRAHHHFGRHTGADLIVVLDNGEIVEQGTHEELLSYGGLYCEMIERQQEAMQG